MTNLFNEFMGYIYSLDLISLLSKIAISLLVFAIFYFGANFVSNTILNLIPKLSKKITAEFHETFKTCFKKPVFYTIRCLGIYFLVLSFPFSLNISLFLSPILKLFIDVVFILAISVSLVNLINYYHIFFPNAAQKIEEKSKTISVFFINIVKALIVALTVIMLLNEFGFDVAGLITGLGLTGLTFALAAQDTASNFFSGVMILIDKPFKVGDWIAGAGIEGVVEEINFRSSRVRTFDNALITVPNNKLSNDSITNWTLMNLRKTKFTIGLVYSTKKDTMQKIIDEITQELSKITDIKTDTIIVRFDNYSASSLDILIQYHSFPIPLPEHLLLKEKVQYIIMDIVEKEDTDFAFQTFTVYNEK